MTAINLKSISVHRTIRQDGRMSLDFRVAFTDYGEIISPMLHCQQHIEEMVSRLRNGAPYMSAHAFEDGLYYLNPGPGGVKFLVSNGSMIKSVRVEMSEEEIAQLPEEHRNRPYYTHKYVQQQVNMGFETIYLTMPGAVLADLIDKTALSYKIKDLREGVKAEIDEMAANRLRYEYREKVRIVYCNRDLRQRFYDALHGPDGKSLKSCVLGCSRISRRYSMGNQINLVVYPDGKESFYWQIMDAEHKEPGTIKARIMNGGWILHRDSDGTSRGFSSHT